VIRNTCIYIYIYIYLKNKEHKANLPEINLKYYSEIQDVVKLGRRRTHFPVLIRIVGSTSNMI